MRTVTVKQIQKLDKIAIEQFGMPSLVLMEKAGASVAEEILRYLKKKKRSVCVVCGLGNNAGDGFVTARYLIDAGVDVHIFLFGRKEDLKADALANYKILKKFNVRVRNLNGLTKEFLNKVNEASVVIDAIFGVGLNRVIQDPFKKVIERINVHAKHIVSIDIPSGLNGTTGKIFGVCVKANQTVTFSFAKKGFFMCEGPKFTGRLKIVDIGIPQKVKRLVVR